MSKIKNIFKFSSSFSNMYKAEVQKKLVPEAFTNTLRFTDLIEHLSSHKPHTCCFITKTVSSSSGDPNTMDLTNWVLPPIMPLPRRPASRWLPFGNTIVTVVKTTDD